MGAELAVAAVGALLVWIFQLVDKNRRELRQPTPVAIASEVQAIRNLLRSDQYLESYHKLARAVREGRWNGESYVIDIRSKCTRMFEATADKLSTLKPEQISKIATFFTYGQAFIDGTNPNRSAKNSKDTSNRTENIVALEGTLIALLTLADEIVQMLRAPFPAIPNDH